MLRQLVDALTPATRRAARLANRPDGIEQEKIEMSVSMEKTEIETATAPRAVSTAKYNPTISYLRASIVVLVIAHHTALGYSTFVPPSPLSLVAEPRWWQAFPVTDAQRWIGFSLFMFFNDLFFMSLMFFLSGLFVWRGLQAKGGARFLRDRLLRLGLPFAVGVAIIAPLTYYPTYLRTPSHLGFRGFWQQWLSLGRWPSGPAWFLWELLAFDCIAALLFALIPKWGETLGRMISGVCPRPVAFFSVLVTISAIAYIPMANIFTP